MKNRGFSLIELILYIALLTIILSAIIPFAWQIIEGGTESGMQQEVWSNARYVSERIKYEIRNASGINSVTTSSISLTETTTSLNPTVISLSSGNVRLTQGAGSPVNLNSNITKISSLGFTNYTSADNKTKNIQFTFTLVMNVPQTRQEYKQSITMESAAELRTN